MMPLPLPPSPLCPPCCAAGVQLQPDVALHSLPAHLQQAGSQGLRDWLRSRTSLALSYSPEGQRTRAGGGLVGAGEASECDNKKGAGRDSECTVRRVQVVEHRWGRTALGHRPITMRGGLHASPC